MENTPIPGIQSLNIKSDVSTDQILRTKNLLQNLVDTLNYNRQALARVIADFEKIAQPSTADVLRVRGFAYSYCQLNDTAIQDLAALVSQRENATSFDLNKLAQVMIRRGNPEDYENAAQISRYVLQTFETLDDDQRWLALHNLAAALLRLERYEEAIEAAETAQGVRQDFRTEALLSIARSRGASPYENAVPSLLAGFSSVSLVEEVQERVDIGVILRAEPVPPA